MPAKSISISLPEALAWKLEQLEQQLGVSRSAFVQKGLLLLIAELDAIPLQFGLIGQDVLPEDIEAEYQHAKNSQFKPSAVK